MAQIYLNDHAQSMLAYDKALSRLSSTYCIQSRSCHLRIAPIGTFALPTFVLSLRTMTFRTIAIVMSWMHSSADR